MVAWGRVLFVASMQAGQGDLAVLALPCVTLRCYKQCFGNKGFNTHGGKQQ